MKLTSNFYSPFYYSIAVLGFVFFCWLILSNGVHDQQILDDHHNLASIERISQSPNPDTVKSVILGNKSGPLGRPIVMATFVLDANGVWPLKIPRFVRTNILLHIITGLLLLWFSLLLLKTIGKSNNQSLALAMVIASIWVMHPMLVSSYLYVVQRMTVLAGLFCLASLITYLKLRHHFYSNSPIRLLLATLLLLIPVSLALLSKENSISVISLIALTEILIISQLNLKIDFARKCFLGLALISTSLLLLVWYFNNSGEYIFAQQFRDFNAYERQLTQTRVFFDNLYSALIPQRIGTGVFQNDIVISRSILSPATTLYSVIALISLIFLVLRYFKKIPFLSFAIAWFFLAHFLEGSIIPLELKYEHRNYLPLMGLIIGIVLFANSIIKKPWHNLSYGLYFLACLWATFTSVSLWSTPLLQAEMWRAERPNSMRAAQHAASIWLAKGHRLKTIEILKESIDKRPELISQHLQLLQMQCLENTLELDSINQLMQYSKVGDIDFATPRSIQALVKAVRRSNCDKLDLDLTLALMVRIGQNESLFASKELLSEIHYLIAEVLYTQKKYVAAARYSKNAFFANNDGKYALTEALCWIKAKMPHEAELALSRAENTQSSLIFDPLEQKNEIERLRLEISNINDTL